VIVGAAAREYMTFLPDCIYHEKQQNFKRMQILIEVLKHSDLSVEKRKEFY
jgi:proline iminopeptidase